MMKPENADKINLAIITVPFVTIAAEAIVLNLIELLKQFSKNLYLITGDHFADNNEEIHIIHVEHNFQDKTMPMKLLKRALTHWRTFFNILKLSKKVDIFIFFIGTNDYLLPMLGAKIIGKRTILIMTGSMASSSREIYGENLHGIGKIIFPYAFKSLEWINLHLSDQIVVYSKSSIDQFGLARHRHKISCGARFVNTENFKLKKDMQNRKNQIGFIGRFSKEKGIMNLVNALPILFKTTNSIEVILIGGGSLFYEIKEKIRQNGYATRVHFSGWISHDKIPDCLSELKLLVLPSYTEGLPNVILEAMACYTPVLSTPVGSIPDVIADGDTGFIMKNNSPECIAENIIRALNFPELDRIVSNARRLIERKYSYKAAAERYRQLLMDDLEVKIGPEFQL